MEATLANHINVDITMDSDISSAVQKQMRKTENSIGEARTIPATIIKQVNKIINSEKELCDISLAHINARIAASTHIIRSFGVVEKTCFVQ